ncbi:ATP-binding protein [Actinoplanes aureus]|uniref:ATP-binding protein n=1 Tax=Actinoplanes aureus TaxID=2792083 RepID=A0A931CLS7_9ACTN|nr:ATP-binding protein [Actinoplanes aureus]MBG0569361.1 ATP-binding protein [Actinoplanes aureus]
MTALPASAPHPGAVELHRWTLSDFRGLRLLRAALRSALAEATTGERTAAELGDLTDRMAVVATELATNALRHGLPPTVVCLLQDEDRLVIDVADHDLEAEPYFDRDRPPGMGGLGLVLARSFAIDVGWYKNADTKHVWASFLRKA